MTELLLENLKSGAVALLHSRVVIVTSSLHDPKKAKASLGKLNFGRVSSFDFHHSNLSNVFQQLLGYEISSQCVVYSANSVKEIIKRTYCVYTKCTHYSISTQIQWYTYCSFEYYNGSAMQWLVLLSWPETLHYLKYILENSSTIFLLSRLLSIDLKELDFENFNLEKDGSYCGVNAYMNSKSALIMFGYTLAEKLKGTSVTVNSLCPGLFTVYSQVDMTYFPWPSFTSGFNKLIIANSLPVCSVIFCRF